MRLPDNRTLAISAVVVSTLLLQIPGLDAWYGRVSKDHTHIVTMVEGLIGVITVVWATFKPKPAPPGGPK